MKLTFHIEEPSDLGQALEFLIAHLSGVRGEAYTVVPARVLEQDPVTEADQFDLFEGEGAPLQPPEMAAEMEEITEAIEQLPIERFSAQVDRLGIPPCIEVLREFKAKRFGELPHVAQLRVLEKLESL